MDNTDEKHWKSWLGESYSQKLINIREKVTWLCNNNKRDLPFFTPHGVDHFQAVEDIIHKLIPKKKYLDLSEKERFFLLASAWLHDVGMLPDLVEKYLPAGSRGKPNEIRNKHHVLSEKCIVGKYAELGVDQFHKEALGKLCRYHRKQEDINTCDKELPVNNDRVRLRLLSAYLRLADALDISASRVPDGPYSMCLTYDIPIESKIHWIKSRIIHSIDVDFTTHKIQIIFKEPRFDVSQLDENIKLFMRVKLQSIIRMVLDDLKSELFSIADVLIKEGITFYLDIEHKVSPFEVTNQMEIDLREMVLNYDIMMAPSASKLLEMILISVANILGYSLYRDTDGTIKLYDFQIYDGYQKKLKEFLNYLTENPLKKRSCHLGLHKLVRILKERIDDKQETDREEILNVILELYRDHYAHRKKIRVNSRNIFMNELMSLYNKKNEFNVLLYGYSEMVSTVLCGFREALIEHAYRDKRFEEIRGSRREYIISKKINIFVCEGQPKTQSSYGDHLIYHDGTQYCLHLRRRNFCNIALIPDIVAGHVIESMPIHLVIVGANGINDQYFRHSAGHSSIINLAREYRSRQENDLNEPSSSCWYAQARNTCLKAIRSILTWGKLIP